MHVLSLRVWDSNSPPISKLVIVLRVEMFLRCEAWLWLPWSMALHHDVEPKQDHASWSMTVHRVFGLKSWAQARPCLGSTTVHHGGMLKLDRAWRSTGVLRVSTGKQAPISGFWKSSTGVFRVSTAVLRALAVYKSKCWSARLKLFSLILFSGLILWP